MLNCRLPTKPDEARRAHLVTLAEVVLDQASVLSYTDERNPSVLTSAELKPGDGSAVAAVAPHISPRVFGVGLFVLDGPQRSVQTKLG